MQKWTYYLTVVNELDRPLELINENLAWGRKEKGRDNFPRIINPGTSAEYRVFSLRAPPRGSNSIYPSATRLLPGNTAMVPWK